MHSYHKALPRVAAVLFVLGLASVIAPRNSIGLPQPQSPIIPTRAVYLPMAVREEAIYYTPVIHLPLTARDVPPTIAPGGDPHGSISGAIWIWKDGNWTVPHDGLVTVECWDGTPGAGGALISTAYSEDGYYLLENIPPGTNYWIRGSIQIDSMWHAEMHPGPVTVLNGQETQYIEPLLMPPS